MKCRETLKLPRARDLKSNKVADIQNLLGKIMTELDTQYRLMRDDIHVLQVDADGFIYYGSKETDGTWRKGRSGNNFVTQRREAGAWVTKDTITP